MCVWCLLLSLTRARAYHPDHHILRLEIAEDDVQAVDVLERERDLGDVDPAPREREGAEAGEHLEQIASADIFEEEEEVPRVLERAVHPQHKRVLELSQARQRYIAGLSHDFGTPIAVLRMFFNKLCSTTSLVTQVDKRFGGSLSIDGAVAALELMTAIKLKAVNLQKLEDGAPLQPERSIVDVHSLVKQVESIAIHMPQGSGASLRIAVDSTARACCRHARR